MRHGYTLTELLVALAIASVLYGVALPFMHDFPAGQRAVASGNAIIGAVQLARSSAIIYRVPVTLCPNDSGQCGTRRHWSEGGLIFSDPNRNAKLDDGEVLHGHLPSLRKGEKLYWRSFRNRSYLRFLPTGLTPWQNGHFQYCPADGDPRFSRQIVLNAQGRVRRSRDKDGDGIVEDVQGRPLRCP